MAILSHTQLLDYEIKLNLLPFCLRLKLDSPLCRLAEGITQMIEKQLEQSSHVDFAKLPGPSFGKKDENRPMIFCYQTKTLS
jgi:hypothetical protein